MVWKSKNSEQSPFRSYNYIETTFRYVNLKSQKSIKRFKRAPFEVLALPFLSQFYRPLKHYSIEEYKE